MVRGVNRQIVEITYTDSPYFERGWLVVRADLTTLPDSGALRREGEHLLHGAVYSALRRTQRRRWAERLLLPLGGAAVVGLLRLLI